MSSLTPLNISDQRESITLPMRQARTVLLAAILVAACVLIGYVTSHHALTGTLLVASLLITSAFAFFGSEVFTRLTVALLPWLVVLIDVTPKMTLTLATAFVALLMFTRARLHGDIASVLWVGAFTFVVMLLVHVAQSTAGEELIEASKYALFPISVLIVSSRTSRDRLIAMRSLLLRSGVAAMALQAVVAILQIGPAGAYYNSATYAGTGLRLGLTPNTPHEMALLGVTVAVACLVTVRSLGWRIVAAAIAATPALATGTRSPLVALFLTGVLIAVRARLRPSVLLGIVGIGAVVIFSGVGSIIITRYEHGQQLGEYTSLGAAGSGRGTVETTLLDRWSASGPKGIVFGLGLRSVERIGQRQLGETVVAQSDPVAVMVELGLIGLVGWLLLWLAIIRAGVNWIVLVPLASYTLTSGSLEYVGAAVFAIFLAAACQPSSDRTPG